MHRINSRSSSVDSTGGWCCTSVGVFFVQHCTDCHHHCNGNGNNLWLLSKGLCSHFGLDFFATVCWAGLEVSERPSKRHEPDIGTLTLSSKEPHLSLASSCLCPCFQHFVYLGNWALEAHPATHLHFLHGVCIPSQHKVLIPCEDQNSGAHDKFLYFCTFFSQEDIHARVYD